MGRSPTATIALTNPFCIQSLTGLLTYLTRSPLSSTARNARYRPWISTIPSHPYAPPAQICCVPCLMVAGWALMRHISHEVAICVGLQLQKSARS